jgi:mono/diheme cytochrome c family protein
MTQGKRLAAVMVLAASVAMPAFAAGTGDADYKAKCASCHGADGLAATPMGKGKMPAYEGKLTDAQIKDVIGYIRTLQK